MFEMQAPPPPAGQVKAPWALRNLEGEQEKLAVGNRADAARSAGGAHGQVHVPAPRSQDFGVMHITNRCWARIGRIDDMSG